MTKNHNIRLDPDQEHALELMLAGGNISLGGRAGSGKSTVLAMFRELCSRNTAFLAPTGLAAHNIGGSTIHRFLGLGPAFIPTGHVHMPTRDRWGAIAAAKTIVIDEISMLRSDLFQTMAGTLAALPLPDCGTRPFGGRQIIVCGDMFQLAPVVTSQMHRQNLNYSFGGIFAFKTLAWHMALFETAWLGYAHRQGVEHEFVDALDTVRTCWRDQPKLERALDWINRHVAIGPSAQEGITLCVTKKAASAINAVRDAQLRSAPFVFKAEVDGVSRLDCPADYLLELRVGSRVMVLANEVTGGAPGYVNGDLGFVLSVEPESRTVEVKLDDDREIALGPHVWLEQEYQSVENPDTGEEELKLVPVASFEQIPLKLAYAVTIHKSQGMSLPRVHVDLGWGTFASGQLYVALSRCTSVRGLSLERPLRLRDVIFDFDVFDFHECSVAGELAATW